MPSLERQVIMTGPPLNELGGITAYAQSVGKYYPGNLTYFEIPMRLIRRPLQALRTVVDFVRTLHAAGTCSAVHINTAFQAKAMVRDMALAYLAVLMGRRVFFFIHGWDLSYEKKIPRPLLALVVPLLNRVESTIVLTRYVEAKLRHWGVRRPIAVSKNPISVDLEGVEPPVPQERSDGPRILSLSRLDLEKGLFELLDAYERLLAKLPGVGLDIAGDGPAEPALRRIVAERKLSGVAFHGRVAGKAKGALYRSATVYCLPSYSEGLPISMLDAMYCGCPIVASRVGAIPEIITDGANGFIVEPRNVDELTHKLALLLGDPKLMADMGATNAIYARSEFLPAKIAKDLAVIHLAHR